VRYIKSAFFIVAVGLLAASALGVSAQSEEPSGPITYVTGIRSGSEDVQMPDPVFDADGVMHFEDARIVQSIDWSDPRLPATMILRGNTDLYGEEGSPNAGVPFTGALLLQGDEGSWTGTQVGYMTYDSTLTTQAVLAGQDAYEGLSAILYQSYADAAAQEADIPSWEGIIIDGELPPYPDTPEPLAE
jgi:hypothetical protein